MGIAIVAAVLSAFAGLAEPPEPWALHQELLSRYAELPSFYALVVERVSLRETTTVSTRKIWFHAPSVRVERDEPEGALAFGGERLAVYDLAEGRRWIRGASARWVEEDLPPVEEPWGLWALGLEGLGALEPLRVWEEIEDGANLWVLEGTLRGGEGSMIWIDPATRLVRRARFHTARFVWDIGVLAFDAEAGMAAELFQPPPPEEVARILRASPEGMALLAQLMERYAHRTSFFLRRRAVGEALEDWVYWQPPHLRVEVRTPPSPWFGSELVFAELLDLPGGQLFFYDPNAGEWFREDLFGEAPFHALTELALALAFGGLSLSPILGVEEATLEGRPTWRLTGKPPVPADPEAPFPKWWVDKATLQVVQYAEPVRVPKDRHFPPRGWTWGVRTVRVLEYAEDVELPPELFALPEAAVPRPPLTLPVEVEELLKIPKEKLAPTAPALPWEPFSAAKLEEALSASSLVVLYFSADWCLPCHILEDEAFRAPAVVDLLAPYARLKVDLTRDASSHAVASLYRVRAVPTLLFLDAQGREIGRITGYSGVAALRVEILRILKEVER